MAESNMSTSSIISPSSLVGSRGTLPDGSLSFSSDNAETAMAVGAYASHLKSVVSAQHTIMSEIGPAAGLNSVHDQLAAIADTLSDQGGWRSLVEAQSAAFAKERLMGIMSLCNAGLEAIKAAERDAKDDKISKLQERVSRLQEENLELAAARDEAEALVKEKQESLDDAEIALKGFQAFVDKVVAEAGGLTQAVSKKRKQT